jgi:imidazolonepropionase-like amidohydrolase
MPFLFPIVLPVRKVRYRLLLCLLLLASGLETHVLADAQLFENARVLRGDGTALDSAAILLIDGVINAVGDPSAMQLPENLVRHDLQGKTVMPALIDAHAHLGYEGISDWGGQNYNRENLIDHLQRYAWYGFSAVFSAGSDPAALARQIQQEQRAGQTGGARLLFAAGMGPPGQGPNNQFLEQAIAVENALSMPILYGLENPQQARDTVRHLAAEQINFLKIWVDDRGGSQQKLSPDLYRAVASEATTLGMPVFVHQQAAGDMLDLIDAGVSGFLHGRLEAGFTPDIALAARLHNVFIVPNLGLAELRREAIGADPFLSATLPPMVADKLQTDPRVASPERNQSLELELRRSVATLLAADTAVVLGTDAGALPDHPFGYSGHRELEIYVRLGMTPMQAIIAGTSAAARALGLAGSGLIRTGYRGDLLVLNADPSVDIRNTREIAEVYLAGKRVDRDALQAEFTASAQN